VDQQAALATVKHYLYTTDRDAAHEIYHEDAVLESHSQASDLKASRTSSRGGSTTQRRLNSSLTGCADETICGLRRSEAAMTAGRGTTASRSWSSAARRWPTKPSMAARAGKHRSGGRHGELRHPASRWAPKGARRQTTAAAREAGRTYELTRRSPGTSELTRIDRRRARTHESPERI
jgi:hypothetical protein